MDNITIKGENIREILTDENFLVNSTLFAHASSFKQYKLQKSLRVELSTGLVIVVPKEFKHDKSSILKIIAPLLFISAALQILSLVILGGIFLYYLNIVLTVLLGVLLYEAFDNTDFAAIVHDYLYQDEMIEIFIEHCGSRKKARKVADKEFLYWLLATKPSNKISINNYSRYVMYFAVRLFGGFVY